MVLLRVAVVVIASSVCKNDSFILVTTREVTNKTGTGSLGPLIQDSHAIMEQIPKVSFWSSALLSELRGRAVERKREKKTWHGTPSGKPKGLHFQF